VAAVLVRDVTPAEIGKRLARQDSQDLDWVDPLRPDRAQVRPVVTEIEHVHKLLTRMQPRQPDAPVVLADRTGDPPVGIGKAEPPQVGQSELLQVRAVPAGERVVDDVGELFERMAERGRPGASWQDR
jgi:hypothetical protein